MAKYKITTSAETIKEAENIAKATQRPGQSKEQTKLIAQGIQKGIEQYKKQHKSKARQLDKKLKTSKPSFATSSNEIKEPEVNHVKGVNKNVSNTTLWILLFTSWVIFGVYIYFIF